MFVPREPAASLAEDPPINFLPPKHSFYPRSRVKAASHGQIDKSPDPSEFFVHVSDQPRANARDFAHLAFARAESSDLSGR